MIVAVVVALGVLAVLHRPHAWWGYVVGAASGAFLIIMSVFEAKRAWVAVDERSV